MCLEMISRVRDIRGSVRRYDPWGIKATGFTVTRKDPPLLTRSRGGPATRRCGTRASEQAGKALRSQGHQCAHVM